VSGVRDSRTADIKFPEGRWVGKTEKKLLVAYASKYGPTGGVANAIGMELCSKGMTSDVALINPVDHLGSYRGVVIGSPIYRGNRMPEVADFVKKNKDILRQMPVANFLVCMTLSKPTEEKRAKASSCMDLVLKDVPEMKPVRTGILAGASDSGDLSRLSKGILKSKGTPEGDYRDWTAIQAWAREPLSFMAQPVAPAGPENSAIR